MCQRLLISQIGANAKINIWPTKVTSSVNTSGCPSGTYLAHRLFRFQMTESETFAIVFGDLDANNESIAMHNLRKI